MIDQGRDKQCRRGSVDVANSWRATKQVVAVKHCVFLSILIVLILLLDSGFCLTFYYMFV